MTDVKSDGLATVMKSIQSAALSEADTQAVLDVLLSRQGQDQWTRVSLISGWSVKGEG